MASDEPRLEPTLQASLRDLTTALAGRQPRQRQRLPGRRGTFYGL